MNNHTDADSEAKLHPFLADHERAVERLAAAEGVSVETYRRARKAYQDALRGSGDAMSELRDRFYELKQAIRIMHLIVEENFEGYVALRDMGQLDGMETTEDLLSAQSCHVLDMVKDFEAKLEAA